MITKKCGKCKIEKSIEEFHKSSQNKSGLKSSCKQCRTKYYFKNKTAIQKYKKQYRKNNKEKISKHAKWYYQKIKGTKKEYYRKWYSNRLKTDEVFAFKQNISNAIWRYLRNINASKNNTPTLKLLNITYKELEEHFNKYFNQPCTKCKQTIIIHSPKNYQIDHILPISFAKTKEEILYLNRLDNLRLICGPCNLEKRDNIEHPDLLERFEQWRHEQQEQLYELVNF